MRDVFGARDVDVMKERDAGSGEVYFDYVCRYCDSTVINIARRIQANARSARPEHR